MIFRKAVSRFFLSCSSASGYTVWYHSRSASTAVMIRGTTLDAASRVGSGSLSHWEGMTRKELFGELIEGQFVKEDARTRWLEIRVSGL